MSHKFQSTWIHRSNQRQFGWKRQFTATVHLKLRSVAVSNMFRRQIVAPPGNLFRTTQSRCKLLRCSSCWYQIVMQLAWIFANSNSPLRRFINVSSQVFVYSDERGTETGTVQRSAWHKNGTQIREPFHIFLFVFTILRTKHKEFI